MQDFLSAVSTFGFPIVVAAYLLFRFEGKVEKLDDSISGRDGLIDKIDSLDKSVNGLKDEVRGFRRVVEKLDERRGK